ncbi:hypothetical protein [Rubrivirga sp.]|uniref:hypothetical protein n=1 Tax=Rubrivirga sp. TaxID=1885344 RepID=UPI003B516448
MTDFDDRFAERVREVFDAYGEPVDPAAWARMREALGPVPAADRPPLASPTRARRRWAGVAALVAVLAVGGGVWLLATRPAPSAERARALVADVTSPGPASTDGTPSARAEEAAPARDAAVPPSTPGRVALRASGRPSAPTARRPQPAAGHRTHPPDGPAPVEPPLAPVDTPAVFPSVAQAEPPLPDRPLAPAGPSVLVLPSRPPDARPDRPTARPPAQSWGRPALSVVAGVTSTVSDGRLADGGGVSAGLSGALPVGRRMSVSGGAQLAYARFVTEGDLATPLAQSDLARPLDVASRSEVTTLAIEIPFDLSVDVVRSRRARLGVAVGLTSAVYLDQSFRDEGVRYSGRLVDDPTRAGGSLFVVGAEAYETRESAGAGSRVDLARQLTLALRLTSGASASAPTIEVFGRLPLGGLTTRDLPLTTLGARLRVPIPIR